MADTVHIQLHHQMSEGLCALAGSHAGRQGRGVGEAVPALPTWNPHAERAGEGAVAAPQRRDGAEARIAVHESGLVVSTTQCKPPIM